ncbi:MAG TPA: protein kinase, partial [Vicinamibacterales bacterium]|nr:protein kinase [Vicinamibacterales bacterium]
MSIPPGTRLGPYEITGPLGGGGMGAVYSALDTRLGRRVAIKTIRDDVARDAGRRERFEHEAKTIASLTHPHICTLYDVGHASLPGATEEIAFLVMELIEGETLTARLARGPLPTHEALAIARQIADALEKAHSQGIVHRDLKPANIMLASEAASGRGPHVKLLDFGLARWRADRSVIVDEPTRTSALTGDGVVLGTLQYIAPEQLEGRAVDQRADLFAFGAILFEMIAGRPAFEAASPAGLISAILGGHPPRLSTVAPVAPPALDRIVAVCLAKDPGDRWTSAHDLRLLLDDVGGASATTAAPPPSRSNRREWFAWAAAALAIAAAVLLGIRAGGREGLSRRDVLSILPPDHVTLTDGEAPQISPDGRLVAFVGNDEAGTTRLYVRDRSGLTANALAGTDDATQPFWSPDSRSLGFFAAGRLKRIDVSGAALQTLAATPVPRGGTWNQHDVIVFAPFPAEPLQMSPATGGTPQPVPGADPGRWFPAFLPDGRHYLFLSLGAQHKV